MDDLRAVQEPLKVRYRREPEAALITLEAQGRLDETSVSCRVETGRQLAAAGLHPATGGTGRSSVLGTCCSRPWWPAPG